MKYIIFILFAISIVVSAAFAENVKTKTPSVSANEAILTIHDTDRTVELDNQKFVLVGSNNNIKIEGNVLSILVTGDNNDVRYPAIAGNIIVKSIGSNNDVSQY